ncbi:UrcA family protein [Phenylobacterium sp.]|uniref:UrcA family protein n=1 Tax=Phenylobacterium sp. TaxID=1871053 RepID=UPI003568800E
MFKAFHLLATASLAGTLLVSGAAQAQSFDARTGGPSSQTVRYADLDIRQAPGAEVLLRRISVAADRVCGGEPDGRSRRATQAFATCRKASIAHAVARLGAPVVSARYDAQAIEVATR